VCFWLLFCFVLFVFFVLVGFSVSFCMCTGPISATFVVYHSTRWTNSNVLINGTCCIRACGSTWRKPRGDWWERKSFRMATSPSTRRLRCAMRPKAGRSHRTIASGLSSVLLALAPVSSRAALPEFFFCPSPLRFGLSTVLSLTRGPAGNRTRTQECPHTNFTTRTTLAQHFY
jgi:hypothetical protein